MMLNLNEKNVQPCEKCTCLIDFYCADFHNKKTCSDLTIVNKFNWLCLYCLRIYFATWKNGNPGTDYIKTTK